MSLQYNQAIWDNIARKGDQYYRALTSTDINRARMGDIRIKLTPIKQVPKDWIGPIRGRNVLCLACGGGQQGPLFAAAGSSTVIFDLSNDQLTRDRDAAKKYSLNLETVQGDMTDLSCFETDYFDLIINPCSVCFCQNVRPVWREVARVLRPCGRFLTGFINPVNYLFDPFQLERGKLEIRHTIPYSNNQLSDSEKQRLLGTERPIEYGHSLQQLVGGQMEAGLTLTGFYEDRWGGRDQLSNHIPVFVATRATKLMR